jgi:hypothetical protein
LRRTYELLTQVQAPLRGTIVNRVPHRGAYASGYGYGYGYGYRYKYTPVGDASAGSSRSKTDLQPTNGAGPLSEVVTTIPTKGKAGSLLFADPQPKVGEDIRDLGVFRTATSSSSQTATKSEENGSAD